MTAQRRYNRRMVLRSAGLATLAILGAGGKKTVTEAAGYDVTEKRIKDLQTAMRAGQVTSVQLVQAYLDRIAAYDQQGPSLNAVIYLNPNAAKAAQALDDERSSHGARGPLHGIPVLLKDNYDTLDMPTTG